MALAQLQLVYSHHGLSIFEIAVHLGIFRVIACDIARPTMCGPGESKEENLHMIRTSKKRKQAVCVCVCGGLAPAATRVERQALGSPLQIQRGDMNVQT